MDEGPSVPRGTAGELFPRVILPFLPILLTRRRHKPKTAQVGHALGFVVEEALERGAKAPRKRAASTQPPPATFCESAALLFHRPANATQAPSCSLD